MKPRSVKIPVETSGENLRGAAAIEQANSKWKETLKSSKRQEGNILEAEESPREEKSLKDRKPKR